jgi:hypothetical protein
MFLIVAIKKMNTAMAEVPERYLTSHCRRGGSAKL